MPWTDPAWTRALLLAMAGERDLERVLHAAVMRLCEREDVALARI